MVLLLFGGIDLKTVRIKNNIVVEIIPEYALPVEKWYGTAFAAQCVEAPDEVDQHWTYDPESCIFSAPTIQEPAPEPAPTTEDRVASLETETETLKTQVKTIADSDKVNSGTYTGTGLYGELNPNAISPNIQAKVLMVIQNNETILTLSRTESTDEPFIWFASSAKEQCNENGLVYNWISVS